MFPKSIFWTPPRRLQYSFCKVAVIKISENSLQDIFAILFLTKLQAPTLVKIKLRYFNFEPGFKLRWCRALDLFGSRSPVALWPSGLGNYFVCKRFTVQALLWSLKFVIQKNLEHDTIRVWKLRVCQKYIEVTFNSKDRYYYVKIHYYYVKINVYIWMSMPMLTAMPRCWT